MVVHVAVAVVVVVGLLCVDFINPVEITEYRYHADVGATITATINCSTCSL